MSPLKITIDQSFTSQSKAELLKLIGKVRFDFVFKHIYTDMNASSKEEDIYPQYFCYSWDRLIAYNQLHEQSAFLINIPSFSYPFTNIEKHITFKETSLLQVDHRQSSVLRFFGCLNRIQIFHFRELSKEYDVNSLKRHELESSFSDVVVEEFDYLETLHDRFAYLVLYFNNEELLVLDRPESLDVLHVYTNDDAKRLLGNYQEVYLNDDSESLYQLAWDTKE